MLWADVRGRQLGFKFRRQQPIGRYVVDFVCLEKRLIVEVDGWTHSFEETFERDRKRQAWLEAQGYRVVRFDDQDVFADRAAVVETIYTLLHSTIPP